MEFHLIFTEQELNIVSTALVELPFKIAAPLIQKINQQIAEQQKLVPAEKQESAE